MTAHSIRAELASAVRRVNAELTRLPPPVQESIEIGYDSLEAEIDSAILAEDYARALDAIEAWRRYWLGRFEKAAS